MKVSGATLVARERGRYAYIALCPAWKFWGLPEGWISDVLNGTFVRRMQTAAALET